MSNEYIKLDDVKRLLTPYRDYKLSKELNNLPTKTTDNTATLQQIKDYFEQIKEDNIDMPCNLNCKIQPCLNCNEWANHIKEISEVVNGYIKY